MSDLISVQGVVISSTPVGEYDRRIVLLTRERGKIPVFAKGARRLNSPFMAAANPFVFGTFTLYEGRTSYNLNQVNILYQFSELAMEQPGVYYGYYFLELADYFGHEGTDERETMNLLYLTVKALLKPGIDDRLIRCIYELRLLCVQGMMPDLLACSISQKPPAETDRIWFSFEAHGICLEEYHRQLPDAVRISYAALGAFRYIAWSPMEKLYTFAVSAEVLAALEKVCHRYVALNTDRRFRSLQILETMTG